MDILLLAQIILGAVALLAIIWRFVDYLRTKVQDFLQNVTISSPQWEEMRKNLENEFKKNSK